MKNEEVVKVLEMVECLTQKAMEMAISASKDRPKGEWTDWLGNGNEWECSRCKCSIEV